MKTARVYYHHDPDGWSAFSPDVPGYTGFGETYEEVRDEMQTGLPWFAEEPEMVLAHIVATQAEWESPPTSAVQIKGFTRSSQPAPRYRRIVAPRGN
jgi:predicted RNase H-like HicB family nuclease